MFEVSFSWLNSFLFLYGTFSCIFFFRAFVPAVLLGETEQKSSEQSSKSQDQPNVRTHWLIFLNMP